MIIHVVTPEAVDMVAMNWTYGLLKLTKQENQIPGTPPIPLSILDFHPNGKLIPGREPKIHAIPCFMEVLN